MKHVILIFALVATGFVMPKLYAQTEKDAAVYDSITGKKLKKREIEDREYYEKRKKDNLEALQQEKQNIIETEKYELKKIIEIIDAQLEKGEITTDKAKALKEEAAKKAAQNIDNKTAIIENQIELTNRDVTYSYRTRTYAYIGLGLGNQLDEKGSFLLGFEYKGQDIKPKFDKRTYSNMVYAFGVGGTAGGGTGLGDSYKVWKSGYAEIGFTLRTRLLKESNFWRVAYGISFQQNQLSPTDNKYFVNNSGRTDLEVFPNRIKRNVFRIENFTVPIFIEFGPSKKKEYKDYFRYDTKDSFKVGLGGFAGINSGAVQWMKYVNDDGKTVKNKTRQDYNVNKFVYGLKAYVGMGSLSLFATYELNPVFEKSAYRDHALYFGVRVDL
jgi:hypothetical protein